MVIVPRDEVVILDSNIPEVEAGIPVFSSTANYSLNQTVQFGDSIYESLKDNNKGVVPTQDKNNLNWFYKGKTNKYRMFDEYIDSISSNPNTITYSFNVSDIDTVCFLNLEAFWVKVELYNRYNDLIFSQTKSTYTRNASNWYEWTVAKSASEKVLFFKNIPFSLNCTLKIEINKQGNIAKCGLLMFGGSINLGATLTEPKPVSSIRNIASKERLPDGTIKFTNSRVYKRVVLNVIVETQRISQVQNILEEYTDKPLLFIGAEREDNSLNALTAFGFFRDFDKPIGLDFTQYQIEIEGIV
ncbi:hypothetical protein [Aliarcobacter vitoriensis]|uniref:Uncharacterized protein n=1 Tax=Aliarcobacter vitoriensis TaxID=2011099 RepID=A0A366MQ54_9BACT|nr:hypothetical protein [Aliarcobacter vitoriensis]RBQ28418.1 hypothetical protein CRU91_09360 [Aliarcobacter vitoriensis]